MNRSRRRRQAAENPPPQPEHDAGTPNGEDTPRTSEGLSESLIVRAVAKEAAQRITRRVVADLQQMKDTMSADDSELKTTWDEICVQVQEGESFYQDAYDGTVRAIVADHISKLPKHEQHLFRVSLLVWAYLLLASARGRPGWDVIPQAKTDPFRVP